MGLVLMGCDAPDILDTMIRYASDTQHEKIKRGLAVAVALISFRKEEGADALIDQLLSDKVICTDVHLSCD